MPPRARPCLQAEAAAAGRAGGEHERVADQAAERVLVGPRDGRGHEGVRRVRQQRDLAQRLRAQRVGVAAAPVLVDQRAAAQVADARAAPAQEAGERARLGREVQRGAHGVHGLLERRARVRRAERDGQAHLRGPLAAAMAGGARDEPAHRVPDERDPLRVEPVQQRRERRPVLGDVAAGVVADEDRRHAELLFKPLAVGRRAPRVLALAQAMHEHHHVRRRARPCARSCIGIASELPSASSRSP